MAQSVNQDPNQNNRAIEEKLVKLQGQHVFYTGILLLLTIAIIIVITLILLILDRDTRSNVPDQRDNVDALVQLNKEELSEPKIAKPLSKPARVFLYAQPNSKSDILTGVKSASMLLVRQQGEVWTEVATFDGIPVWVQEKDIRSYVRDYSKLTTQTANAYSKPSIEAGEILGTLDTDDILQIIVIQKGWYRVWSPRTFSAWVKTSELKNI